MFHYTCSSSVVGTTFNLNFQLNSCDQTRYDIRAVGSLKKNTTPTWTFTNNMTLTPMTPTATSTPNTNTTKKT